MGRCRTRWSSTSRRSSSPDSTGTAELSAYFKYAHRYGVDLLLARVNSGTYKLLQLTGIVDEIGDERFYPTVNDAVDAAVAKHGQPK